MNLDSKLKCKCGKEKSLFQFLIKLGYSRSELTTDFDSYRQAINTLLPKLKCSSCKAKGFISVITPNRSTQKKATQVSYSKKLVATDRGVNRVFHKQSCGYAKKIRREDEVFFDTREEATKRLFEPCRYCKP